MSLDGAQAAPSGNHVPQNGHLLSVHDLRVWYPVRRGLLRRPVTWSKAVDGVSFHVSDGETMALVGESGAGKTTTGRAVIRIQEITSGSIYFAGESLSKLKGSELRRKRRHLQMIFQDPYGSLDPRQTVEQILSEPLGVHNLTAHRDRASRVKELLALVGLDPAHAERYPREFSGGQRQRIGIARAIALQPKVIVCDEPVSSLDVSMQAQIINLLTRLQRSLGIAYLFIAHDLAVVRHIAHRVAVMYLGRIVEMDTVDHLYDRASHPYTVALLSAAVVPTPRSSRRPRIILAGEIPSPDAPPIGCRFHPRCWLRARLGNPEICETVDPSLRPAGGSPAVACHFAEQTQEWLSKSEVTNRA